jgi:hypothetical protein
MREIMILGILASLLMVLSGVIYAYAAETITITGEPIDTYCYVLMGAKGGESPGVCDRVCQEGDSGRTTGRWHKQGLCLIA